MALNDFDNYADLHDGVTGDTIRAAADDPNQNATVIAALASELGEDEQHVAGEVEGDIEAGTRANPQEAQQVARNLAQAGYYAVGLLNEFAGHVDTFDAGVDELNRRLRADVASAQRYAGQAAAHSDEEAPDYAETWASIRASMVPEYNRLDNALEEHAESIASRFEQGPTPENVKELVLAGLVPYTIASSLWPNLTLTEDERRQALQNEVAHMTPEEQAAWVRANSEVDPQIVDVISEEAQEILADDVANDIQDPEEIDAETVRLLDLFKEEPAFASALYGQISPTDMGDAIGHLNSIAYPNDAVDFINGEDEQQLYRDFLTSAGATLATYTRGEEGHRPPHDLVDTWYDAITATDSHDPNTGKPVNSDAAALTLLIRAGGQDHEFASGFIGELTGRIYEWERDQDGAVWGPRNDDPPIYDPFRDPQASYNDRGGVSSYSSPASDGLANLLGGMASSPEAALDFFHGRYEGAEDSMEDKLDYFVGGGDGRTWDAGDNSDEGDGLGLALEAAIVGQDSRSEEGTQIVNKLFANIAEHGGEADGTFDNKWHVGPAMTDSLGAIASGYTGDLYDQLSGSGAADGPLHLDVDDETLAAVLGEIGRPEDKTGLETLTAAMMLQAKAENGELLNGIQGDRTLDNVVGLQGRQEINGRVMGELLTQGLSLAGDEDKTEEARAAMLSKAIDVTAGFIPGAGDLLGEGASHLATSSVDALKGGAIDALKAGVAASPDTDEYLDGQVPDVDRRLQIDAIDSLIENGYLGPQETAFSPNWQGVPPEILVGDPPHVDPRLIDADGPEIDTEDMTPAEQQQAAAAQEAWRNFTGSPEYSQVIEHTHQSTFYKYFIDPSL